MMGGDFAMGWMWVWPALIVAGLVIIGYVAVRLAQGRQPLSPTGAGPGSAARRILDERYARGEIDEEEYRHRRDVLS